MSIEIRNMTPHPIKFLGNGKNIIIPPSGQVFRCNERMYICSQMKAHIRGSEQWLDLGEISIYEKEFHHIDQIPEYNPNIFYIVSIIVAQENPQRLDFIVPNEIIRYDNGMIKGCRSFVKYTEKRRTGFFAFKFLNKPVYRLMKLSPQRRMRNKKVL